MLQGTRSQPKGGVTALALLTPWSKLLGRSLRHKNQILYEYEKVTMLRVVRGRYRWVWRNLKHHLLTAAILYQSENPSAIPKAPLVFPIRCTPTQDFKRLTIDVWHHLCHCFSILKCPSWKWVALFLHSVKICGAQPEILLPPRIKAWSACPSSLAAGCHASESHAHVFPQGRRTGSEAQGVFKSWHLPPIRPISWEKTSGRTTWATTLSNPSRDLKETKYHVHWIPCEA